MQQSVNDTDDCESIRTRVRQLTKRVEVCVEKLHKLDLGDDLGLQQTSPALPALPDACTNGGFGSLAGILLGSIDSTAAMDQLDTAVPAAAAAAAAVDAPHPSHCWPSHEALQSSSHSKHDLLFASGQQQHSHALLFGDAGDGEDFDDDNLFGDTMDMLQQPHTLLFGGAGKAPRRHPPDSDDASGTPDQYHHALLFGDAGMEDENGLHGCDDEAAGGLTLDAVPWMVQGAAGDADEPQQRQWDSHSVSFDRASSVTGGILGIGPGHIAPDQPPEQHGESRAFGDVLNAAADVLQSDEPPASTDDGCAVHVAAAPMPSSVDGLGAGAADWFDGQALEERRPSFGWPPVTGADMAAGRTTGMCPSVSPFLGASEMPPYGPSSPRSPASVTASPLLQQRQQVEPAGVDSGSGTLVSQGSAGWRIIKQGCRYLLLVRSGDDDSERNIAVQWTEQMYGSRRDESETPRLWGATPFSLAHELASLALGAGGLTPTSSPRDPADPAEGTDWQDKQAGHAGGTPALASRQRGRSEPSGAAADHLAQLLTHRRPALSGTTSLPADGARGLLPARASLELTWQQLQQRGAGRDSSGGKALLPPALPAPPPPRSMSRLRSDSCVVPDTIDETTGSQSSEDDGGVDDEAVQQSAVDGDRTVSWSADRLEQHSAGHRAQSVPHPPQPAVASAAGVIVDVPTLDADGCSSGSTAVSRLCSTSSHGVSGWRGSEGDDGGGARSPPPSYHGSSALTPPRSQQSSTGHTPPLSHPSSAGHSPPLSHQSSTMQASLPLSHQSSAAQSNVTDSEQALLDAHSPPLSDSMPEGSGATCPPPPTTPRGTFVSNLVEQVRERLRQKGLIRLTSVELWAGQHSLHSSHKHSPHNHHALHGGGLRSPGSPTGGGGGAARQQMKDRIMHRVSQQGAGGGGAVAATVSASSGASSSSVPGVAATAVMPTPVRRASRVGAGRGGAVVVSSGGSEVPGGSMPVDLATTAPTRAPDTSETEASPEKRPARSSRSTASPLSPRPQQQRVNDGGGHAAALAGGRHRDASNDGGWHGDEAAVALHRIQLASIFEAPGLMSGLDVTIGSSIAETTGRHPVAAAQELPAREGSPAAAGLGSINVPSRPDGDRHGSTAALLPTGDAPSHQAAASDDCAAVPQTQASLSCPAPPAAVPQHQQQQLSAPGLPSLAAPHSPSRPLPNDRPTYVRPDPDNIEHVSPASPYRPMSVRLDPDHSKSVSLASPTRPTYVRPDPDHSEYASPASLYRPPARWVPSGSSVPPVATTASSFYGGRASTTSGSPSNSAAAAAVPRSVHVHTAVVVTLHASLQQQHRDGATSLPGPLVDDPSSPPSGRAPSLDAPSLQMSAASPEVSAASQEVLPALEGQSSLPGDVATSAAGGVNMSCSPSSSQQHSSEADSKGAGAEVVSSSKDAATATSSPSSRRSSSAGGGQQQQQIPHDTFYIGQLQWWLPPASAQGQLDGEEMADEAAVTAPPAHLVPLTAAVSTSAHLVPETAAAVNGPLRMTLTSACGVAMEQAGVELREVPAATGLADGDAGTGLVAAAEASSDDAGREEQAGSRLPEDDAREGRTSTDSTSTVPQRTVSRWHRAASFSSSSSDSSSSDSVVSLGSDGRPAGSTCRTTDDLSGSECDEPPGRRVAGSHTAGDAPPPAQPLDQQAGRPSRIQQSLSRLAAVLASPGALRQPGSFDTEPAGSQAGDGSDAERSCHVGAVGLRSPVSSGGASTSTDSDEDMGVQDGGTDKCRLNKQHQADVDLKSHQPSHHHVPPAGHPRLASQSAPGALLSTEASAPWSVPHSTSTAFTASHLDIPSSPSGNTQLTRTASSSHLPQTLNVQFPADMTSHVPLAGGAPQNDLSNVAHISEATAVLASPGVSASATALPPPSLYAALHADGAVPPAADVVEEPFGDVQDSPAVSRLRQLLEALERRPNVAAVAATAADIAAGTEVSFSSPADVGSAATVVAAAADKVVAEAAAKLRAALQALEPSSGAILEGHHHLLRPQQDSHTVVQVPPNTRATTAAAGLVPPADPLPSLHLVSYVSGLSSLSSRLGVGRESDSGWDSASASPGQSTRGGGGLEPWDAVPPPYLGSTGRPSLGGAVPDVRLKAPGDPNAVVPLSAVASLHTPLLLITAWCVWLYMSGAYNGRRDDVHARGVRYDDDAMLVRVAGRTSDGHCGSGATASALSTVTEDDVLGGRELSAAHHQLGDDSATAHHHQHHHHQRDSTRLPRRDQDREELDAKAAHRRISPSTAVPLGGVHLPVRTAAPRHMSVAAALSQEDAAAGHVEAISTQIVGGPSAPTAATRPHGVGSASGGANISLVGKTSAVAPAAAAQWRPVRLDSKWPRLLDDSSADDGTQQPLQPPQRQQYRQTEAAAVVSGAVHGHNRRSITLSDWSLAQPALKQSPQPSGLPWRQPLVAGGGAPHLSSPSPAARMFPHTSPGTVAYHHSPGSVSNSTIHLSPHSGMTPSGVLRVPLVTSCADHGSSMYRMAEQPSTPTRTTSQRPASGGTAARHHSLAGPPAQGDGARGLAVSHHRTGVTGDGLHAAGRATGELNISLVSPVQSAVRAVSRAGPVLTNPHAVPVAYATATTTTSLSAAYGAAASLTPLQHRRTQPTLAFASPQLGIAHAPSTASVRPSMSLTATPTRERSTIKTTSLLAHRSPGDLPYGRTHRGRLSWSGEGGDAQGSSSLLAHQEGVGKLSAGRMQGGRASWTGEEDSQRGRGPTGSTSLLQGDATAGSAVVTGAVVSVCVSPVSLNALRFQVVTGLGPSCNISPLKPSMVPPLQPPPAVAEPQRPRPAGCGQQTGAVATVGAVSSPIDFAFYGVGRS